MKVISLLLIPLLVFFIGCKTIKPSAYINAEAMQAKKSVADAEPPAINFSDQSTWLLGYFKRERLISEPYSSWFIKGYDEYHFNTDAVNKLTDISKDGLTLKIVLGTWCPDSRREVPRFMRILDLWQFPVSGLTFIGVDNAKLSPVAEYENLNIQRVPTFIIYRNNIEAGRIIENPATSLEQDIINILKQE
jgi:hypothetical protein